jgi:hypothetical protein
MSLAAGWATTNSNSSELQYAHTNLVNGAETLAAKTLQISAEF